MVSPIIIDSIVYGSLFALMSLGLTLSYLTSRVPNFAHGSFVTLGAYVAYALSRFYGFNPYVATPISFVIGGIVGFAMYLLVLRPLMKRGSSVISLMIATFAVVIVFTGVFGIYADYLANVFKFADSRYFLLSRFDFNFYGLPGLFLVAPVFMILIFTALYIFFTKTTYGTAMRASVIDPDLSEVIGINTQVVYSIAWFLAGGFAGLSGDLFILRLPGNPNIGLDFTVAFFAASLLGGLSSIYGALIGGIIIGAGEILIATYGTQLVGIWWASYQPAIPMIIMVIGLILVPEGIVSIDRRSLRYRLGRLRFRSLK